MTATDPDGNAIVYAIAGGADAAKFSINPNTGALAFLTAPNFEAPTDAGGDNVYNVIVSASDGSPLPATQSIAVTVTDVDELPNGLPSFTSGSSFTVTENGATVGTVSATDPDEDAVVYAITGGADAARFGINPATGALAFLTAPNFEAPADADADNVYEVIVGALDNVGAPVAQTISVTVQNVDESPPSNFNLFGSSAPTGAVVYNDGSPVELGMKFTADRNGQIAELRYYRHATDAGDTDVRQGHLWGPDGTLLATATFTSAPGQAGWQVATLSTPVAITAGLQYVVSYRTQNNYVATDNFFTQGNEVAFDGLDNDAFTDLLGILSAPESTTAGGNGVYVYGTALVAPDQTFGAANYWVDVSFDPADGSSGAPTITSGSSFTAAENQTTAGTVTATDPDGNAVVYATAGGADAAKFSINSNTGALAFLTAPNFEAPADANADNIYEVIVSASDNIAAPVTQAVTVTVTDATEGGSGAVVSLFNSSAPTGAVLYDDGSPVELGMKLTADSDGQITELRYYRHAGDGGDTDVRDGHLWGPDGTLLATATFTSAPGQTGWQVATLSAPVSITAGLQYVVSYRTQNNYVATDSFFTQGNEVAFDGLDNDAFTDLLGILSAPESTTAGGNGVYVYGTTLVMPDQTYGAANYWVDVSFLV